jgi:hypothetical protein
MRPACALCGRIAFAFGFENDGDSARLFELCAACLFEICSIRIFKFAEYACKAGFDDGPAKALDGLFLVWAYMGFSEIS